MAAFNFPDTPSTNQTHTENGITWKWNGSVWKRVESLGEKGQKGEFEKGQKGEFEKGQKGEFEKGEKGEFEKGQKGEEVKGQKGEVEKGQKGEVEKGEKGVVGSTGVAGLDIATTPPGSPTVGDLWWDSDDGDLHVYYNDGSSSQWVTVSQGPAGPAGGSAPFVSKWQIPV